MKSWRTLGSLVSNFDLRFCMFQELLLLLLLLLWSTVISASCSTYVDVAVTVWQHPIHYFSRRTIETWKWLCLLFLKQWKTVVGTFYSHVIKYIWVRTHAFLIIRVFPIGWAKEHSPVEFTLISIMNHESNPTRLSNAIKD